MFAVIESGSKQYMVKENDVIKVEKLNGKPGDKIEFDKIIFSENGKVKVTAEILEQKKAEKVIVFKKRRRHNYRRKIGHRQNLTILRISKIS